MPIYFARLSDPERVKVGFSKSPRKRVSDLQVACPSKLELVGTIPGDRAFETHLHRILRATGTRTSGEWYEPSPALDCLLAVAEAGIDLAPLLILVTDEQINERLAKIVKPKRPTRKRVLSDAERKRRSDNMKRLRAEGKVGPQFGHLGGRPSNEQLAQKALSEFLSPHQET